MADAALSVSGLGKDYAGPVLCDVDLDVAPGEVLALTGENGAGKSTLSKIVAGIVPPSRGAMRLGADPYAPKSRREAEALGVRMVMQELNLVPTLSVAENLFLERLPSRAGWIDRRALREAAREAMARVGLKALDPDAPVETLGVGFQQMVEIARSLVGDCRVLILDEPTAALTGREVDLLFTQVEALKRRGVAVVYISHRLEELRRVADRVAVLRDGRLAATEPMADCSTERLVGLMVGRQLADEDGLGRRKLGPPLLRVRNISRGKAVSEVSFEVRGGEILGLSGLVGAGRTELLRLIYGADRADHGTVEVGDPPSPARIRSPTEAVRRGIAMISEDRKDEGLLLPQSVAANVSLGALPDLARWGIVDDAGVRALAARRIEELHIRAHGPDQPVEELSGGNQQKVVIGRILERDRRVFLFDEPTRGVDVGAKHDIHELIMALAKRGKAVVVASSDLRELMQICDRIAVMSAGRLVRTFNRGKWSEDSLLAAAFSGYLRRDDLLNRASAA